MKKLIYILMLAMLSITACKKEIPEPDSLGYGISSTYTNKYILTGIQGGVYRNETVWYSAHYYRINPVKVKDTVKYKDCYIEIDLDGNLISENTFFSGINAIEQKCFVNKIVSLNVIPDCIYNDSISPYNAQLYKYVKILYRDKFGEYYDCSYHYYNYLLYTPIKIELSIPPDTNKWVSFTIRITDDKGNAFTTTTDKVFVTK